MNKTYVEKPLVVAIILLFISVSVIPSTGTLMMQNETLTELIIEGSTHGKVGGTYTYRFYLTDSEGCDLWLNVDWDDGTNTGWLGPYDAEEGAYLPHGWDECGIYTIRAGAKGCNDSYYNATLEVTITSGNILYVGGSGPGNYSKIQDAIDNASNGDTVFVYDDSSPYYETLVVDKSIQLIGEDRNTTVINGRKTYEEVVTLNAGNSILGGFTIKNSDTTKRGIYIYSDNNHISDCNVVDNRLGGIYFSSGGYDNNHISHCYFRNPDYMGIYINGAGDELATGNVFSNCTFDGDCIILYDAPETVVSNCEIYGPYANIDFLGESDNCQIINCSIHSSNGIGITTECDGTVIKDCIITNCSEGIRIAYSPQETRIINCTITDCSEYHGIIFWGGSYKSIISGCNLKNNWIGLSFFGTPIKTNVFDCNIANNGVGIEFYFNNFFNRFYRNNFINNTKQIDPRPEGTYVWCMFDFFGENYWSDWKGNGPYHVYGLLNWDFHPVKEPYDIGE